MTLIVECDPITLAKHRLDVGKKVEALFRQIAGSESVILVSATTTQELCFQFGVLAGMGRTFDNILIVGHSDRERLQLASDALVTWDKVAEWVRPFRPRDLVLLACEAGSLLPLTALFGGIPTLTTLHGADIAVTLGDAAVGALVYQLIRERFLSQDALAMLTGFSLATGRAIWKQVTRAQFRKKGTVEKIGQALIEEVRRQPYQ